ncbi:MAG: hypothetical protein LC798_07515 [Chloroflexi bacterium]|nr:hypothetical protein [Chloroflexota bacterium]
MATTGDLLAALARNGARLGVATERVAALQAERIALYRAARAEGLSWSVIGASAGVSDTAVIHALARADKAAASDAVATG